MRVAEGTRALVTGAGEGIGRAVCEALAARGVSVGLAGRGAEALEVLNAELPGFHHVLVCDAGDPASMAAAVADLVARAGGLQLVVAADPRCDPAVAVRAALPALRGGRAVVFGAAAVDGLGVGVTTVLRRERSPHDLAARVLEAVDHDERVVREPLLARLRGRSGTS